MRRAYFAPLIALALVGSASAQSPTPTFRVITHPSIVVRPAGVVQVTYRLQFLSTARDSLASLAVLSPVPVAKISVASVRPRDMLLGKRRRQRHVASWAWLASLPHSGHRIPGLSYEAIGLPGIVSYRAERDVPVREARPGELNEYPKPVGFDVSDKDHVVGKTVGVVAFPADRTPAGQVAWLRGQVREACGLGWIEAAACRRLDAKLATDGLAGLRAELGEERGEHDAERGEDDTERGHPMNELARILLTSALESLAPQDSNHESR
jgi:hypothetical protein